MVRFQEAQNWKEMRDEILQAVRLKGGVTMFVKMKGRRVQKQNKKSACIFETQPGRRADGYGGRE